MCVDFGNSGAKNCKLCSDRFLVRVKGILLLATPLADAQ